MARSSSSAAAHAVDLPEVDEDDVQQLYGCAAMGDDPMAEADHVSLPSSGSDTEQEVELPDGSDRCCAMECHDTIMQDKQLKRRLEDLDAGLRDAPPHDKAKLQYDCMRVWQRQDSGWRRFSVFGTEPCCQKTLQKILQMGHKTYLKFCKSINEGFMEPPTDARHTQHQRSLGKVGAAATTAANTLLKWIYENMAEHLPESDRFVATKKTLARNDPSSAAGFDEFQEPKLVKWLAPGTSLSEMREFALAFNSELRPPSFATFSRVFHTEWQGVLKTRTESQHSKCNDCAKLKAWRRQCHSKEDVELVQRHLEEHIRSMKEDRKVDATINMFAQQSAKGELTDPEKTVLSLVIDGMDEAKFKIPRRVEATKQLQAVWRPECRFIGCLAEGLTENFFIGDSDLVKDANLDLTLVSHVIHEAQKTLEERGVVLPSMLRLHSDNASSELKNVLCMKFCAWLAFRGMFREIWLTQFRVGHSHGLIDQRFSECRTILSNEGNLQTPQEFLTALQKVKARQGRVLNLEQVHAAVDFQAFFSDLETTVSGHTQTKRKTQQGEEAVHVFIFQLRKKLPANAPAVNETFPEHPPHPEDVILCCRHYISSPEDSQPPQVMVPHALMMAFDSNGRGPSQLCGRRQFTERQCKEFTKTAEVVSQPPWNMHEASAYLLRLIQCNQDGGDDAWQAPSMSWVLRGSRADHMVAPERSNAISADDLKFVCRQPAPVTVSAKPAAKPKAAAAKSTAKIPGKAAKAIAKKGMKRPASAAEVREPETAATAAAEVPLAESSGGASPYHVSLPSPDHTESDLQPADGPKPPTASSAAAGAPPRTAVEVPKPEPKSKKKEKTAKTKQAKKPKHLGRLPMPPDARDKIKALGHSKCRQKGCPDCRVKVGLILNEDETAWIWDPKGVHGSS